MLATSDEIKTPVRTGLSSRWRWAIVFGVIALVAATPLLYLYLHPIPYIFDTTIGEATIHFESSD